MSITYAVGQRLTATLLQTLADYTVNKPLVRLVQQSAQSLTDNTDTALTFGAGSEDIDTDNFHDETTNNTRITPTVAGYYLCRATLFVVAATDYASLQIQIKRSNAVIPSSHRVGPNATNASRSVQVSTGPILMNGSTDYLEAWALQDNAANAARNTASTGSNTSCIFECEFMRPA